MSPTDLRGLATPPTAAPSNSATTLGVARWVATFTPERPEPALDHRAAQAATAEPLENPPFSSSFHCIGVRTARRPGMLEVLPHPDLLTVEEHRRTRQREQQAVRHPDPRRVARLASTGALGAAILGRTTACPLQDRTPGLTPPRAPRRTACPASARRGSGRSSWTAGGLNTVIVFSQLLRDPGVASCRASASHTGLHQVEVEAAGSPRPLSASPRRRSPISCSGTRFTSPSSIPVAAPARDERTQLPQDPLCGVEVRRRRSLGSCRSGTAPRRRGSRRRRVPTRSRRSWRSSPHPPGCRCSGLAGASRTRAGSTAPPSRPRPRCCPRHREHHSFFLGGGRRPRRRSHGSGSG